MSTKEIIEFKTGKFKTTHLIQAKWYVWISGKPVHLITSDKDFLVTQQIATSDIIKALKLLRLWEKDVTLKDTRCCKECEFKIECFKQGDFLEKLSLAYIRANTEDLNGNQS